MPFRVRLLGRVSLWPCQLVRSSHRRTGRGGGGGGGLGGLQPPQMLGNSDFLGSKRNLGKASCKRNFHVFCFLKR